MSIENTEPTETTQTIDPNTDNLDDFAKLVSGEAEPTPVAEEELNTEDPSTDESHHDNDQPTDEDESEEEQEQPKPVKKKVNSFQERINELTAKAREAERKLAELESKSKPTPSADPAPNSAKDDGPTPDDTNEDGSDKYPLGEFDPKYIRDLTRFTIQTEQAAAKEQQLKEEQERATEQARTALDQEWQAKLGPVSQQYDDFLDKTLQLEDAFSGLDENYSDYLVQTIKSLDHGPEVLYYFANNLDEAKKFVQMGAFKATLALGEYNAMFKSNKRATATKVSKAPPPPQVNKGSTTSAKLVPADTDDLAAFEKMLAATNNRRT